METFVKILPNDNKPPLNKLADAEVHFRGGTLDGMKLMGFAIWRRHGRVENDVVLPSREFTVDGRRRRYALLRPVDDRSAQNRIRDVVLRAYVEYEAAAGDGGR
jgi:hypothetical protein